MAENNNLYVTYEYKKLSVEEEELSMLLDCYESFGWIVDNNIPFDGTTLNLKRDRKIINKMELTRLQNHFEACLEEIKTLEASKTQKPTIWSLVVGMLGTAFMAGATFAAVATPPIIWLCILLAIPGFIGWSFSYFVYKSILMKEINRVNPFIDVKREEIYEICQKGHSLL